MNTENISISSSEKIGLISNLSTMLSAGISILEVVDSLLEDSHGNQKKILSRVKEDLIQGKHLYASFTRFPAVFDKVLVSILKAAEEAGTLDVTLKELRDTVKKQTEFSDKVKSAMMYPLIIMLVFVAVIVMILVVVMPKISMVFMRMTIPLPLPTRVMIFASNILLQYTVHTVILFGSVFFIIFYLYKTQKRTLLNFIFSFPGISNLARLIDLTQFSRSFSLLLSSGIPINSALDLTADVVVKHEIKAAIVHSKEVVLSGKKLSEGFRDAKHIIPSIMIKITEAGERSGSLERSMLEISEYLDYQVNRTLATILTLLEPVMMVIIGVMVGGMMMAIISPIYGLIGQVGGR